ncbi:MAG: hypothetical protein U0234_14600 [Sandaracinus sp.]
MRTILRLVVSLALAVPPGAIAGCSCGGPGPFQYSIPDAAIPSTLPTGSVPIDPSQIQAISACSGIDRMLDDTRLVTLTTGTLAARADGTVDVALSTDECVHFTREIAGGVLVSATFYGYTGQIDLAYDPATGEATYGARRAVVARWEQRDGALHGQLDADARLWDSDDTTFEVETIERARYYQVTRRDAASGEIAFRLTDDAEVSPPVQTTERQVGGVLQVVDTTVMDASTLAQGPSTDDCTGTAVPCDEATAARLEGQLAQALARGSNCLMGEPWMTMQGLRLLWSQQHEWSCMAAGCDFAQWCGVSCPDAGAQRIYVDTAALARGGATAQLGVLFHEFMHGVIGTHLGVVVNSGINDAPDRRGQLMRRYVDPVDACEAYCFDAAPTRCDCATCLDTVTCDPRCSGLASCVANDCSGEGGCVSIMSEAVGAAAVTGSGSEASAEWYPTLAECQMAMPGADCRSFSRSCEPGCE